MTMTGYMVRELGETVERWGRSLVTLPPAELERQRLDLVRLAEGQSGASPAALILQQVDVEIARRADKRRA
jgi:hypothetical protein